MTQGSWVWAVSIARVSLIGTPSFYSLRGCSVLVQTSLSREVCPLSVGLQ